MKLGSDIFNIIMFFLFVSILIFGGLLPFWLSLTSTILIIVSLSFGLTIGIDRYAEESAERKNAK